MTPEVFANEKGCALLAAIDAGLIPRTAGGYDTAKFDKFWQFYVDNLVKLHLSQPKSQSEIGRKGQRGGQ